MKKSSLMAVKVITLLTLAITACAPNEASAPLKALPQSAPDEAAVSGEALPAIDLGACANPFYPVGEGRTWEYRATTGEETSQIRFTQKDVSADAFTRVMTSGGDITTEIRWTCGPDGLFSSEDARMNLASMPNFDIETLDVSGVAIPPAEQWQVGFSWETKSTVRMTTGDTQIEAEGEYTVIHTIAAVEAVSVPAGRYANAYRVDAQSNIKFNLMGVETELSSPYSSWFVEGIGMVKTASGDPEMPYTMELIAFGGS